MTNVPDVSREIKALEDKFDDDTESIITNERYVYISSIIGVCCTKNKTKKLTTSDKIDRVVTNRWLALPIFAVVMWLVYYVSVTTVGGWATDWANDGVFGDGWHLFGSRNTGVFRLPKRCQPSPNTPSFAQSVAQPPTVVTDTS